MTNDQIKQLCIKYDFLLHEKGFDKIERNHHDIAHIRWMCHEIPNILDAGKFEKANRWLGFVQGALWAYNISTIEDLKEDNR